MFGKWTRQCDSTNCFCTGCLHFLRHNFKDSNSPWALSLPGNSAYLEILMFLRTGFHEKRQMEFTAKQGLHPAICSVRSMPEELFQGSEHVDALDILRTFSSSPALCNCLWYLWITLCLSPGRVTLEPFSHLGSQNGNTLIPQNGMRPQRSAHPNPNESIVWATKACHVRVSRATEGATRHKSCRGKRLVEEGRSPGWVLRELLTSVCPGASTVPRRH